MANHRQAPEPEEEDDDDFSFPLIVANSPCSIDSPLWLYSPLNSIILDGGPVEDIESRLREEVREKSEKGVHVKVDMLIRDGSREEKMDMLWEDFNEELWGSSTTMEKGHSPSEDSHILGYGKVTVLSKGSDKGGGALSTLAKRPGAVAFVKELRKKLFLLRSPGPVPVPGTIKIRLRRSRR